MEFTIGQTVMHETLGEGVIIAIEERSGACGTMDSPILKIDFKNSPREQVREISESTSRTRYVREMSTIYDFREDTLKPHLVVANIMEDVD